MNKKINDDVFGEMEYKFGWFKKEVLSLWGNKYELIIKAVVYNEKNITEEQKKSYLKLKSNIDEISKNSLELLKTYIFNNYGEEMDKEKILEIIEPKTVLFKQNGDLGILCDTSLDEENGLVIIILPKYEVGIQDIFL